MRRLIAALPLLLLIPLAGCSPTPSQDAVADRFLTELTDSPSVREAMQELADDIALDAANGECGNEAYEAGLTGGPDELFYAWRVTCHMYYEDDLTPEQIEETKQMVLERAQG